MAASLSHGAIVIVGKLFDDPGYLFDSFGNNANETSRGANFSGTIATWNSVPLTIDSTGASNGISWSGTNYTANVDVQGFYDYTNIYPSTAGTAAGTAADANNITNTGIHGYEQPTINVSTVEGTTYSVDLLFSNSFSARTFDVQVDGQLYLDDLAIYADDEKFDRPQVYRFSYLAADDQMAITLTPGSALELHDDPFVNAIIVTEIIPEPSSLPLLLGAFASLLVSTRRRVKV